MNNRMSAFVSSIGRHSLSSLAKDMGIQKAMKVSEKLADQGYITPLMHKTFYESLKTAETIFSDSGIKLQEGVILKAIETGIDAFTNTRELKEALSYSNNVVVLGANLTEVIRTNAHIGKPTTERVMGLLNSPYVEYNEKELANSDKDYIQANKHKNLNIKSGFNEKSFTFFMEDTYLTVGQMMEFFATDKDTKLEESLLKKRDGIIDIYAAIYKKINEFRFTNLMDFHDVVLKLHLIKITDIHDDPRNLIYEFTNNSTLANVTNNNISNEDDEFIVEENYTNVPNNTEKRGGLRGSKNNRKEKESKLNQLREWIKSKRLNYRDTNSEFGRLPEDDQYSDPEIGNSENRFATSFNCSLKTKLTDSIQFRDRAKIVHTWGMRVTPASTWEFNLSHHLGKGIHMNYLYDIQNINKDHPIGFIFVLESFGDRRAKLIRKDDLALFPGHSPVSLTCQFKTKLGYLGQESGILSDDDKPVYYRKKRKDEDFKDGSELGALFCPDREGTIHVPYENIQFTVGNNKDKNKDTEFKLHLDKVVLPDNSLLEKLQMEHRSQGFDHKSVTEADSIFKVTNPPQEPASTPSPKFRLDLDEEDEE